MNTNCTNLHECLAESIFSIREIREIRGKITTNVYESI